MKKELIRYTFIMLILAVVFTFIYPTLYRYDKYDQKIPVRINRITGKTELLSYNGWELAAPTGTPSIEPKISPSVSPEIKTVDTYNGETYKEYYARVLLETPGETLPKSTTLFIRWERARLGLTDKLIEPKDYFTIGSTKEEVKKVMGPPNALEKNVDGLDRWVYESATVTFENGKVKMYLDSLNKLLVR